MGQKETDVLQPETGEKWRKRQIVPQAAEIEENTASTAFPVERAGT
jgi:hypothetical protein